MTMLNQARRQELAEIRRDADRRKANVERAPHAMLLVTYLETFAAMTKRQLTKDRLEELAWTVEHLAQQGSDIDLETTLRIHAYVEALIAKE
jgi:hypothetical protein